MTDTDFNLLEHKIPVSSFREHIQERYGDEQIEASRVFLLASFGEISIEEFEEKFSEIYGVQPTSLEIESIKEQKNLYGQSNEEVLDDIQNILSYIYGANHMTDAEAEETLDRIRESSVDELEITIQDFVEMG